jgi:predicted nuclease of predicted toxin-antitoxin system
VARLYANENFPRQVANALAELGHDVLTVLEAGNADKAITDEEVLEFATQNNRAVVTLDRRDFIRLHASHPEHAGIIVCTSDVDINAQAVRIHEAIENNEPLKGKLIRVTRPNP